MAIFVGYLFKKNRKIMNFNEWFDIQNKCHKSLYGHSILDNDKWKMAESWEACKNEILKILENNKREICSHGYDAGIEYVYLNDIKEKIEEL